MITDTDLQSIKRGFCPHCHEILYVPDIDDNGTDRFECMGDNIVWALKHGTVNKRALEKCNEYHSKQS